MSQSKEKPLYGGQAVIEGVMMRGRTAFAVAVRDPEQNIVIHTEPLNSNIYDSFISKTPFLRGLTMLWDALGLGMKSLMFSADVAGLEDEEKEEKDATAEQNPSPQKEEAEERDPSEIFKQPAMIGTVLFSLSLSIGLFIALPAFIAGLIVSQEEYHLLSNAVEGVVRLVLVIGYIWGIGFMPEIARVYGYHGAEHKTINAYEAGAELTPQSVQRFPLEHPHCGTGFLLTVVIISILLFSFVPPIGSNFAVQLFFRVLSRIVLIPIVAGIAYEFLRFTARNQDNAFIRAITKPNLALQKLTTREPELEMLEVAIKAFLEVLHTDQGLKETAAAPEEQPEPATV